MVGRSRTLFLLALLTATALSGCTARGEAVTVEAPAWSAGYTWSYEGSTLLDRREQLGDETDNMTLRAHHTTTRVVTNTGMDADGEPVYVTAEQVRLEDAPEGEALFLGLVGDDTFLGAYRQRDLMPISSEGVRSETCNAGGDCTTTLQGIVFHDDEHGNDFLPFPLHTGDTWRGTYPLFGEELPMTYTAEVGRMHSVETPLGPVDAVRIEVHHRPADVEATIRAWEEEAREEGFAIEDLHVSVRIDTVLYYSPTYQNIVHSLTMGLQRFSATIPDGDGGTVAVREEARYEERLALAGARLVPGPERTLDEVAALLAPGTTLDDVAGDPVPESVYRVAVVAVDDTVNAFAGEAGRFEARLDGIDALPGGHALRWGLLDRDGREVDSGDGVAFEPAPADPGRYAVLLEAVDGDGVVHATAGAALAAHHVGRVVHDCGPANVEAPGVTVAPCNGLSLPVHPGATSFSLVATPQGVTGGFLAQLTLADGLGREVPVENHGDHWRVELASFDGTNLGSQAWYADWESWAAVEEDVVFDFEVFYGADEGPQEIRFESDVGAEPLLGGAPVRLPGWLSQDGSMRA